MSSGLFSSFINVQQFYIFPLLCLHISLFLPALVGFFKKSHCLLKHVILSNKTAKWHIATLELLSQAFIISQLLKYSHWKLWLIPSNSQKPSQEKTHILCYSNAIKMTPSWLLAQLSMQLAEQQVGAHEQLWAVLKARPLIVPERWIG